MTKRATPFSLEVRERAVRMVRDHEGVHGSQRSAIQPIAAEIGCSGETRRNWVRQLERDPGVCPGQTTDERERIAALERENRELRQANEILCQARRTLPWRSSTAGRGHDQRHQRSSGSLRGQADLQGAADCPVDLLCACCSTCRSREAIGSYSQRRRVADRDPTRLRGQRLRLRLRLAEGLAAPGAGGDRDRRGS